MKWFRKWSVTAQVLLLLICVILPINIISITFAYQMRADYLKQSLSSVEHIAELSARHLDDRIATADNYMYTELESNQYIAKIRYAATSGDALIAGNIFSQDLIKRVNYGTEADGYFFYRADLDFGNISCRDLNQEQKKALYDVIKEKNAGEQETRKKNWYLEDVDGGKWLIHCSNIRDYYFGSVLDMDTIGEALLKNVGADGASVVISETPPEAGKGQKVVSVPSQEAGIYLNIILEQDVLMETLPAMHQMGFSIACVFALGIPLLIVLLRRLVILPLKNVNRAMQELEDGNAEYRITEPGANRETAELNRGFNSMAGRLKDLRIQVYEEELERMDVEATNLRLQVNPHFILNSLNIIFSLAKSQSPTNLEQIKRFTKYLANYLRFTLWHTGGKVRLADEMRGVDNYLELQKIRFPERFSYVSDIGEDVLDVSIPSLLIINFVENSIKYALDMEREIEIIVIAKRQEDRLHISVCDTGNGMEPGTAEQLEAGEILENETGKHIGIWNCRRRMSLMYGDRAYFHITSRLGEGTQIFIEIPMEEENQ